MAHLLPHPARPQLSGHRLDLWFAALALLAGHAAALASTKKDASPPPAPHPAPSMPRGPAPAMPHMPSAMPGGAHMPGQAPAGVHLPASVQGGPHVPTSMSPHVPTAVHSAAPVRAELRGPQQAVPRGPSQRAPVQRVAVQRGQPAHPEPKSAGGVHPNPVAPAGHFARSAAIHDPRLASTTSLRTRGIEQGMAAPHPPRPYLRADLHRDVPADRAFVARHAGDFHTRDVREFTAHERDVWRAGNWHNEWHYGRRGWWWQADGVWYPYPEPLWPYPEQVALLTVYETPTYDGPDLSALEAPPPEAPPPDATPTAAQGDVAQAPEPQPPAAAPPGPAPAADPATGQIMAAASIPPLPPAPVGWYRCESPAGYFPAQTTCAASWDLVPTAPLPGDQ